MIYHLGKKLLLSVSERQIVKDSGLKHLFSVIPLLAYIIHAHDVCVCVLIHSRTCTNYAQVMC